MEKGDDLLVEVLIRLPSPELVVRCILVCKRWRAIISSSYFVSRYISHHHRIKNITAPHDHDRHHLQDNRTFVNIIWTPAGCHRQGIWTPKTHFQLDHNSLFQRSILDFRFIPVKKKGCFFNILAVFNDLFLCAVRDRNSKSGELRPVVKCYLCNPYTEQWVALPPRRIKQRYDYSLRAGLICEPYYYYNGEGGAKGGEEGGYNNINVNEQYRYRVVLINHSNREGSSPVADMYSSETGKWSTVLNSDISGYTNNLVGSCTSNIVVYKGELYWFNEKAIVAFDPFHPEKSRFIKLPAECGIYLEDRQSFCLGLCR
ncbi:hypothetical protein Tsubulata_050514, partial [Turnera subulata]